MVGCEQGIVPGRWLNRPRPGTGSERHAYQPRVAALVPGTAAAGLSDVAVCYSKHVMDVTQDVRRILWQAPTRPATCHSKWEVASDRMGSAPTLHELLTLASDLPALLLAESLPEPAFPAHRAGLPPCLVSA